MSRHGPDDGAAQEESPRGKVSKAYGLDVYVIEPPSSAPVEGIVVIIPDAIGWEFVNARLLADRYAKRGAFKVYLPEFMEGNAAPVSMIAALRGMFTSTSIFTKLSWAPSVMTSFVPWMIATRISKTAPVVKSFLEQLRQDEGARLPVGVAGFSWGGKHMIRLTDPAHFDADGKPLFDAGFAGHPVGLTVPDEIDKMAVPTSIAVGDLDHHISGDGVETVRKILEAKPDGQKGEIRTYENCGNGFTVGADFATNEVAKGAAEEAEEQCIAWFRTHFKSPK